MESTIMIVCDEAATSRIWGLLLTQLQCKSVIASSVSQGVTMLEECPVDVIVVDAKSRRFNGVEACRTLREHVATPILLFTPINNESHTLEAYQAGVDDCVIKPVSPELFLAKVRVWLRRGWTVNAASLDQLMIGNMVLEPATHELVSSTGERVRLSNLEFRVLYLLMSHPNEPFSNEEIIRRVWGFYGEGNSALVKNVIYRLRKKIEPDPDAPRHIRTETGGYVFRR